MPVVTELVSGLAWPEGPSVLPDGRVIFVETYKSRVSYWAPDGSTGVYADTGGGPNATAVGSDGAVYLTQNGGVVGPWRAQEMREPSIQRIAPTGEVETVATGGDGQRFQAPNDLAFGADGSLYVTDPGRFDPQARPDPGYIWRVASNGSCQLLAELESVYPNGIVVESSGAVVWVESYTRRVVRLEPGGDPVELAILDEGHVPDGLKVALDGSLYVTSVTSGGIDVVAPTGGVVSFLGVGAVPTNCAFAGSTLYVTDGGEPGESEEASYGGRLWRVELDGIAGLEPFRGRIG